MGPNLIALVGLIYLGVCVSLLLEKKYAMAFVFFGYALSNVGFFYAIK